jgi:hypothetical protein
VSKSNPSHTRDDLDFGQAGVLFRIVVCPPRLIARDETVVINHQDKRSPPSANGTTCSFADSVSSS